MLGGGLVPGSLVLLGGEPGIGKSTLVLALCGALARADAAGRVLYASGEESAAQLRLRADAPGSGGDGAARGDRIDVLPETVRRAHRRRGRGDRARAAGRRLDPDAHHRRARGPGRLRRPGAGSRRAAPGAAPRSTACRSILVGHVTKDGTLAGPKTLEHLVDVVLTLEGERFSGLRLLRSSKNRFGSTEEVGVFEMAVARPDRGRRSRRGAFLETDSLGAPGVAVAATLEGSRPLLVEVQALVAPQVHGSPRRTAAGLDTQRLALLIAVLGRRAGMNLASHDVYASIVGGLTVEEPAIDLPLALALASALRDRPLVRRHGAVRRDRADRRAAADQRPRPAAARGSPAGLHPGDRAASQRSRRGLDDVRGIELIRVGTLREADRRRARRATSAGRDVATSAGSP